METFELAGPERLPCVDCLGKTCPKCDGVGSVPQMHAYTVVKHKATEGYPLSLVCGAAVSGYVTRQQAKGIAIDDIDENAMMFEMLGALSPDQLRLLFKYTTRDGLVLDPDVAYDGNYQEMARAVARIGGLNSFFGRRSSV
jgi:hypothetical protein